MIGELAAVGAAIAWSFSSVFYRKALSVASPFQANLIRFTSVSTVLTVLFAVLGKIGALASLPFSVSVITVLSGIIGLVLGDTLYMFSLRSLGIARAVPICFTYPLFSMLIVVLIKGEKVTLLIALGAISIVAGTWIICSKKSNSTGLSGTTSRKGYVTALSTAIVWSVGIALLNFAIISPGVIGLDGILAVTFVRLVSAWIVLLALCPIVDREFGFMKVSWQTWLMMASGGLVALGVGNFLLSSSFLYIQAARAVPLSSTTPFFSVVAGIVILHEPVTPGIVLGSIIIVLGTVLLFIY